MIETERITITQARALLDTKEISSVELTRGYLEEIQRTDDDIHAYLEVFDDALDGAERADRMIAKGTHGPLTGIPMAFKDNILIEGKTCSGASKILEKYVASYDATVTSLLKDQEAVFLGRLNMDEFAMGASTEYSAYGPTKNPHDLTKVPGGTSGGTAAAVASGTALFALGSDTAGSVRQPASFCGVVGFKPTYGATSRSGLMAMGSSLDTIGSATQCVSDAEIVFSAISGPDPLDATCATQDLRDAMAAQRQPKRIGVPRAFLESEGIADYVQKDFVASLELLAAQGYEIVDIELPTIHMSLPAYYIILPAEVSTNLSRYDGVRYGLQVEGEDLLDTYMKTRAAGFGPEARRRIVLGTYVLSTGYYDAYYGKATNVRKLITKEMVDIFAKVDVIATPTTPTEAFGLGETASPLEMYMADLFTVPANITGVPAISIPSGKSPTGLPLGLQLFAPHFQESHLFEVGKKFEEARGVYR
jgi:aspartyl-tRNA(Asn)/glutamyl-tRNA(Gln) amidotransferase subunit A